MENTIEFLQSQFAVSQNGISQSWLFWAVISLFYALKIKLTSRNKKI
jgi:hypothetical protein